MPPMWLIITMSAFLAQLILLRTLGKNCYRDGLIQAIVWTGVLCFWGFFLALPAHFFWKHLFNLFLFGGSFFLGLSLALLAEFWLRRPHSARRATTT